MKKRILSFILALMTVIGTVPLAVITASAERVGALLDDLDPTKPVVTLEATQIFEVEGDNPRQYAKPDASEIVYLKIKANPAPLESITVYYETRDGSAIASTGDYEAKKESVVLTPKKPEVTIAIQTTRTEFAMMYCQYKNDRGYEQWEYSSRTFDVVLTGIEGDARIDSKKSLVQCALNGEHLLESYISYAANTYRGLRMTYMGIQTPYILKNVLKTTAFSDNDGIQTKDIRVTFPSEWLSDYIESSLGCQLYVALKDAHVDEHAVGSYAGMSVFLFNEQIRLNLVGVFEDDEYFGWGPAMYYEETKNPNAPSNEVKWEGKYQDYHDNVLVSVSGPGLGTIYFSRENNEWPTDPFSHSFSYMKSENLAIIREWGKNVYQANEPRPEDFAILIKDYNKVMGSSRMQLAAVDINGGWDRMLTGGDVQFSIEDVTAPTVEKEGSFDAIYHNFNTVKVGEKLRVSIRFTEPVQVDPSKAAPYLTGKINGLGTGDASDPNTIRFEYVGGSCTDTLYFETDYNSNFNITSITGLKIGNATNVSDFAGVFNVFDGKTEFSITGIELDMREPKLSVLSDDVQMIDPGLAKEVTVTASEIGNGTLLYYAWTDSMEAPTTFKNKLVLNNVSINSTKSMTLFGDGDGLKFLHMMLETKYGKKTGSITVLGEQTSTRTFLGPYYFDNTGPTVDEAELHPLEEGSDMRQKTYSIPLPTDLPTVKNVGFSEMRMYCEWEDGTVIPVPKLVSTNPGSEAYVESDFVGDTNKRLNVVLTPADLGMGTDERKTVTIFFTMTDTLGNTQTLGRHSFDFDTYSYIDTTYIGSSAEFADKTEVLPGEDVLLYSNDKLVEVGIETYYYIFEYRVKNEENLSGDISITVSRNGTPLTSGFEKVVERNAVRVFFTEELASGYYDIQLRCLEDGTLRVSRPYRVYAGAEKGALGDRINSGTVLINKVYQLPASSNFYYMDTTGSIGAVQKELYNGTTLPASFSSFDKAKEFVLFHEYRDLYPITLTTELADSLNSGKSNVQKALGETTMAREGQVWVRYKSASWMVGDELKSNWVYYYYGTSEILDIALFSKNLREALDDVAERITQRGQTVALTDLSLYYGSNRNLLDEHGAPYLSLTQMQVSDTLLSSVSRNATYATDLRYVADDAIYSSNVAAGGVEYPLVGNETICPDNRYFYKRMDESGTEVEDWTEIVFTSGQTFGEILTEEGRYKIRELGTNGAYIYSVYIDQEAPMVSLAWVDKDGNSYSQLLSASSEKEFRAGTFRVIGIDAREVDRYAYVALYNISDLKLYGVYTMTELQREALLLPDGSYYMVVADRSGNSYGMSLYINSSPLNCEVKITANVRLRFSCDRRSSQIQEFYVKRNGVTVTGQYGSELDFIESGIYEIYAKDIYGNVFGPEIHNFERAYPTIEWKYRDESGYYVTYDPKKPSTYFNVTPVTDGTYSIATSVNMKFQLPSEYGFEFLDEAPDYEENLKDGSVTISSMLGFRLKVFYKKHPSVYTIYQCSTDTAPPKIEVSTQTDIATPDEIALLKQVIAEAVENGTVGSLGSVLIPPKISYSVLQTETFYLSEGQTVLSDFIKVNATDENEIASIDVYLDGEVLISQSSTTGFSDIVLSRAGEYRIVAMDTLGNCSEFTFKNDDPDAFQYLVDGESLPIGLHDYENFDAERVYQLSNYGNKSVSLALNEAMEVFYAITDRDGSKVFVFFDVSEKGIREVAYVLGDQNRLDLKYGDKLLFDLNDPKVVADKDYEIFKVAGTGLRIYARKDFLGKITLSVYVEKDSAITVEARLSTANDAYYYVKTELSSIAPKLQLYTETDPLEMNEIGNEIRANSAFRVSTATFKPERITSVEVYFSDLNDLGGQDLSKLENLYEEDKFYVEEGFYLIRGMNIYGNEVIYYLHVSDDFTVTSYTEFSDDYRIHYSAGHVATLYSNARIVFEAHAVDATYVVKKNGEEFRPIVSKDGGILSVILSEAGVYTVRLTDSYGNSIERRAEIDTSGIWFNEDLLTGYNENALKRDEGYTNQLLTIEKDVLKEEGAYYLALQYGDTMTVLRDALSETVVELDEGILKELIGSHGDGEYTVILRNRYGASVSKVIHYRGTTTLTLERETRSSTEPEAYDLSQALSVGFWSNSTLLFSTDASEYVFTVNGDKQDCPKTLAFASAEMFGRTEYDITYVDEYGFSYTFKAYLVRQTLEVTADPNLTGQYIDDIFTTRDPISVTFTDGAFCTYTRDNGEAQTYTAGQKLTRDGMYRILVSDYAGNVAALTVKKDTVVEAAFLESSTQKRIQSGAIVNSSKVTFDALNKDSAYIEKVVKDGVIQKDFEGTKFAEDGKWEILLSDKLGNRSYFCFYIVTHARNGFAYTTPYEHRVTELWFDNGDGVKISYMHFVNHNDAGSSFEFIENGKYTVRMASTVTGATSEFNFKVDTTPPDVSLVGCEPGETTILDITLTGCEVGDTVRVYRASNRGEDLLQEVKVSSQATQMPTVTEGGEYRIVVESEAGVQTELKFVRKHVMNTAGSVFIMVVIGIAVIGLFTGLVYRNKSKTDD